MSTPSEQLLSCPAPAKLNLFLHVVGRRSDGYHLLQTLFRFLEWGDTLQFRLRADGAIVRVSDLPEVPVEQDLVVRAARLLQAESGCRLGVEVGVEKRLPLGGGLGGGSSDAATTLIALNRLWSLGLSRGALQGLALRLGADVPVFIYGRSAFAEGIGEELQAVTLPPAWYVVLQPAVAVATAAVFAARELTRDSKPIKMQGFSAGPGKNDLQPVVCKRHPEIARQLEWLQQFAAAGVTGSGACVFAAFDTERAAREVLSRLPGDMSGVVARGIDRHPLWDWLQ
jgi:4-diphosphocytidyl-2-C-methyl-D-erythritol kinase